MNLQEPRVVNEILCEVLCHVHRGHISESFVPILRSRLANLSDPVGRTLGGQRETLQLSTIMMLPITDRPPSSLRVITMPALLPIHPLRPGALYSSSTAARRAIARGVRH